MTQTATEKLIDSFGRVHDNLRISVTDRCNIRCFYCMPAEDVVFMNRNELLTFEEKLKHAADQKISLDLDDGVRVNYAKFGDLLAEAKAICGTKEED